MADQPEHEPLDAEALLRELERVRAELDEHQRSKRFRKRLEAFVARSTIRVFIGPGLVAAFEAWLDATRQGQFPTEETARLAAAIVRRFVRVSLITVFIACLPIAALVWQNLIMRDQLRHEEGVAKALRRSQLIDILYDEDCKDGKTCTPISNARERSEAAGELVALERSRGTDWPHLRGARLDATDLWMEDLDNVDLSRAEASKINLNGAKLRHADLSYANLREGHLQSADLTHANLARVRACDANLFSAVLIRAEMHFAELCGADLLLANLQGANLIGASLANADLREANLSSTNLGGADLRGTDLSGANLSGAKLEARPGDRGVTFADTPGTPASLKVCHDASTRWPVGFVPPPPECDEVFGGRLRVSIVAARRGTEHSVVAIVTRSESAPSGTRPINK